MRIGFKGGQGNYQRLSAFGRFMPVLIGSYGSKAAVRRGQSSRPTGAAQAQVLLNGFQDRGISALSMRHELQIRYNIKDETARLQAAYCKGRRFGFGIDFQPNCHPSGSHLRSWHRDIKRSMLARAITDLELAP